MHKWQRRPPSSIQCPFKDAKSYTIPASQDDDFLEKHHPMGGCLDYYCSRSKRALYSLVLCNRSSSQHFSTPHRFFTPSPLSFHFSTHVLSLFIFEASIPPRQLSKDNPQFPLTQHS